jgi:hypothetical protein
MPKIVLLFPVQYLQLSKVQSCDEMNQDGHFLGPFTDKNAINGIG